MMRDGPIPLFAHGMIEYVGGALFVALPFLLGYDSGAATAPVDRRRRGADRHRGQHRRPDQPGQPIPRSAHVALDYVLAAC